MKKCSVIVCYNPCYNVLVKNISILNSSGVCCIVVDNTPSGKKTSLPQGNVLVSLGSNVGIAKAQNIGIEIALKEFFDLIFFFDQDTELNSEAIDALVDTVRSNSVSIVAPVFLDVKRNFFYKIVDISAMGFRRKIDPSKLSSVFTTSTTISSGMLVKSDVFSKVGLMDESLFIDYVDTEWCLRCFNAGYLVHVNPNARMRHSIGENSIPILGFKIPVHSPSRRYYRMRNSILLFRKPAVPKLLAVREFFVSSIHQMILILSQKEKIEYIRFWILAIFDGLRNKSGSF